MPELTDLSVIRTLCEKYDFALSKGFGQNFIINPGLPPKIVDASGVDKSWGVLEIGPGIGVLTKELAQRAAKVVSIEVDERLPPLLAETMAGNTYLNYYLQQKEFVEHSNPERTRANEVEETREKNLFDGIDHYEKTGEIDESTFYAGSHGDWIADLAIALKNDTKQRFLVICENKGAIPNMPYDAMVELPAYIGKNGPEVISRDNIPLFQQGLMMQQLNSEKLVVEATIEGSYEKALKAFTLNKTVPSMKVAKEVLDDMIEANKGYWPELK